MYCKIVRNEAIDIIVSIFPAHFGPFGK